MKTQSTSITRKFQVQFQLGGRGSEHIKLTAAITALQKAARTAKRSGDCQGIKIGVNEYNPDGSFYGHGELSAVEKGEIEAATYAA